MATLPARLVALLLAAPLAACAGGGSPNVTPDAAASAEGETPPRMVSNDRLAVPFTTVRVVGGPAGTARIPSTRGASRPSFTIAVQVDEGGRPDLSTLVVEGLSNADQQEARRGIEDWLTKARFEPARRDGVAVRGTFRRTFGR